MVKFNAYNKSWNPIKNLFITDGSQKYDRVFVPASFFQASLIFLSLGFQLCLMQTTIIGMSSAEQW
jgi:hypothetical protein